MEAPHLCYAPCLAQVRLLFGNTALGIASLRWQSVGKKVVPVKDDKSFVETDARKICEHVCINYLVEGKPSSLRQRSRAQARSNS